MDIQLSLGVRKVKSISDYQFGPNITNILFKVENKIRIIRSKNTNKIRYIYDGDDLLLSFRPTTSFFTLSPFSAQKILKGTKPPTLRAVVLTDTSEFIKKGRNVFCKHVVDIDESLRPLDEVIVVDQNDTLLAIGKIKIPISFVRTFKRGIAINIRKGIP